MKILLMMLILVFTIPLMATSVEDNTATNSLRISIINSKEELEREFVPAVSFEILAVKPEEIVLLLPTMSNKKFNTSVKPGKIYIKQSIPVNRVKIRKIPNGS